MIKRIAKKTVVNILGWQVRRLRRRHSFRVIAVAGSIGKTSTKFALHSVLQQRYRVQFQEGNYNDLVTVPLTFFGLREPQLFSPFSWLGTFVSIERQLRRPYPYEVVLVELGTDGPGQLARFAAYLQADIGVLTAIAPEHMEFFHDLDAVAQEELQLAGLCHTMLVNTDLCDEVYVRALTRPIVSYGIRRPADYQVSGRECTGTNQTLRISHRGASWLTARAPSLSQAQLYSACAAAAVANELGLATEDIIRGINCLQPVSGRLNRLAGLKDSLIIDDTYNASPEAVKAALDTLYELDAPQKIALLGNMNELGAYSEAAHTAIGDYCNPQELDLVVTIGPDANRYLAPAAKKRGCTVQSFDNPYEAGLFIKDAIKPQAAILAKGSQNRVFAEEAVKQFLADPADIRQLVRQSPDWLSKKSRQFPAS